MLSSTIKSASSEHPQIPHAAEVRKPLDADQYTQGLSQLRRRTDCRCKATSKAWSVDLFQYLSIDTVELGTHDPSCPLHNWNKTSSERRVYLRYPWPISRYFVGAYATLKITKGAGATVLNRSLLCRRVIRFTDHPLALLNPMRWQSRRTTPEHVEQLRRHICSLLANGQVLPTNVDEHGHTLLTVSLYRRPAGPNG